MPAVPADAGTAFAVTHRDLDLDGRLLACGANARTVTVIPSCLAETLTSRRGTSVSGPNGLSSAASRNSPTPVIAMAMATGPGHGGITEVELIRRRRPGRSEPNENAPRVRTCSTPALSMATTSCLGV